MEPYTMTIFWAVLFVVALVVEIQTAELVSIWFAPGILAALIMSFFEIEPWIQILAFGSISVILLVLAFTVFRKKILKNHGSEPTDTDLLLGKDATVVADIPTDFGVGEVKIDGKIWSARMAEESESASAGEKVTVERIEGVKLICRRK